MRVFVSSTFEDLKEYRESVFKTIHSLNGYSDDMIFWSADERDAATLSVDRVRQCDVMILILAHRYGYIPQNSEYSVTELEYRTAREENIPVLAFFVDTRIPWPPSMVDWEKRDNLNRFKEKVENEVTRKIFGTTDELFGLVTQALVVFRERYQKSVQSKKSFTGKIILTDSVIALRKQPDSVLQIGQAEDGLPLLLQIKRTRDLSHHMEELAKMVSSPEQESPRALLESFRQALEQHAVSTWASYQINNVLMRDGTVKEMYITKQNLSELTSSLFARILNSEPLTFASDKYRPKEYLSAVPASDVFTSDTKGKSAELQSVGGQNRFLGISLIDGNIFSLGRQSNKWVEWRPFIFESIPANFPDANFKIETPEKKTMIGIRSYSSTLHNYALEHLDDNGHINASIRLILTRQSVGRMLLQIAKALAEFHQRGRIHGDLKPSNILLTDKQPALIDHFDLMEGDRAPGWTPGWSAPEQVMTEQLSFTADIYPLGVMVSKLLNGILVGEVRKFKTPPMPDGRNEYDVFYNPSLYIEKGQDIVDGSVNDWLSFIKACLRFDVNKRIRSVNDFIEKIEFLLEKHPLRGNVAIKIIESQLIATRLIDGSESIARLLLDQKKSKGPFIGAISLPQQTLNGNSSLVW